MVCFLNLGGGCVLGTRQGNCVDCAVGGLEPELPRVDGCAGVMKLSSLAGAVILFFDLYALPFSTNDNGASACDFPAFYKAIRTFAHFAKCACALRKKRAALVCRLTSVAMKDVLQTRRFDIASAQVVRSWGSPRLDGRRASRSFSERLPSSRLCWPCQP